MVKFFLSLWVRQKQEVCKSYTFQSLVEKGHFVSFFSQYIKLSEKR